MTKTAAQLDAEIAAELGTGPIGARAHLLKKGDRLRYFDQTMQVVKVGNRAITLAREVLDRNREIELVEPREYPPSAIAPMRKLETAESTKIDPPINKNLCCYCGKPTRKGSLLLDEGQTAHRSCYAEFET